MQQLRLFGCDLPSRPALPHFGAKWRLGPWVINAFPAHRHYNEVQCGAANVLMLKPPALYETLNDLNPATINFLRVVQQQPGALIAALRRQVPRDRDEFYQCFEPCTDRVEWARRTACIGHGGHHGAGGRWAGGITPQGLSRLWRMDWDFLWPIAQRLQSVVIQQGDVHVALLAHDSPSTLHYVDPPYPAQARRSRDNRKRYSITPRRQYAYEMFDDDSHIALAATLHNLRGYVVLSGRPCPLYDHLFAGWRRIDTMTRDSDRSVQTESLWLNF